MEQKRGFISKYASMMNRFSHIYFDGELEKYGIGCGQQFFLKRIAENPGISLLFLAQEGLFDKGTTARAVKKLEEQGYVQRVVDEKDKRSIRLYTTEAAGPVLGEIQNMLVAWYGILTDGLSEQEKIDAETIMGKMADNACLHILQKRKPEEKQRCGERRDTNGRK